MTKGKLITMLWLGTGVVINFLDKLRNKALLPFMTKYIMKVDNYSSESSYFGNTRQRRIQKRAYNRSIKGGVHV